MGYKTIDLENVIEQFSGDVNLLFGEELVSVILYGSAATEEFSPEKSDVNFLVLLSDEGIGRLDKVQKMLPRWQKKRITLPLFLTRAYIEASLDSFPIEFFNMKSAYRVIYGDDVLGKITIKKNDLRLECERELKGKLLQLRQGYVLTGGKIPALQRLISDSIITFTAIFRALLSLKGLETPKTKQEVILAMCREFELDEGLFSVLLALRGYGTKLPRERMAENTRRYIAQIATLSEFVDKMKVK